MKQYLCSKHHEKFPENQKLLESLLSEQSGFIVKIMTPTRGKKKDIMNLILKNIHLQENPPMVSNHGGVVW